MNSLAKTESEQEKHLHHSGMGANPSAVCYAKVADSDNILRLPEVIQKTGLGKSTIYRRIRLKTFPSQVDLGGDRLIIRRNELWEVGWMDGESDGSCEAGLAGDEAGLFE